MKILIVGASGLVGWNCRRAAIEAGHEVLGTFHQHRIEGLMPLSLAEETAIEDLLNSFSPAAVICCAAWSWVDGCEAAHEQAYRQNCEEPARLARAAARIGARFLHFSTSYVFDGKAGPYDEKDIPNPISVYGHAKLAGEQAVLEETDGRAVIARTFGVYGEEPQRKNFVYQVRDRLGAGARMRVPCDQFGNASFAPDLAQAALRLLEQKAPGIWNVAGPDPRLSRMNLARRIAREYHLDESLFDFLPTADLAQPAARPTQGGLIIDRSRRELGLEPREWVSIP